MICSRCGMDQPRDFFGPSADVWPQRRHCKPCARIVSQRRRHGLAAHERAEIAAQQGGCRICKRPEPGAKGWCVDHDRSCCPGDTSCPKCRRGVVCQWCNSMLGYAHDNPSILLAGAAYLNAPRTCDWHMPIACTDRLCTDGLERTNGTKNLQDVDGNLTACNVREVQADSSSQ